MSPLTTFELMNFVDLFSGIIFKTYYWEWNYSVEINSQNSHWIVQYVFLQAIDHEMTWQIWDLRMNYLLDIQFSMSPFHQSSGSRLCITKREGIGVAKVSKCYYFCVKITVNKANRTILLTIGKGLGVKISYWVI